jgi:hypothetical protein
MADRAEIVLTDTNILIELSRTGAWRAVSSHFRLATVAKCVEEARSGYAHRAGYVAVEEEFLQRVTQVGVAPVDVVSLAIDFPDIANRIDDGERELWAHARTRDDAWQAVCADQAAVKAACALGWGDRLVSLEELVRAVGSQVELQDHFSTARLSAWRTQALLDGGTL